MKSIEPAVTFQVGEQFSATTRLLGKKWRWVLEVTELDQGRHLSYVVVQGVVKPHVSYRVEPDRDGTRFTMTGGIGQLGLGGRLLTVFARPALRRETADHLKNLEASWSLEIKPLSEVPLGHRDKRGSADVRW